MKAFNAFLGKVISTYHIGLLVELMRERNLLIEVLFASPKWDIVNQNIVLKVDKTSNGRVLDVL